jgi:hypothetical protein
VVKDLVEAPPLILKIDGGLAEIIHLLLLLAVLRSWSLSCSSRRVFSVKDLWICVCNPSIAMV